MFKSQKPKNYAQPHGYKMWHCVECNMDISMNYTTQHKKTKIHERNVKKYEDNTKEEYLKEVNERLQKEAEELKIKLFSFVGSSHKIKNEIDNIKLKKQELINKKEQHKRDIVEVNQDISIYNHEIKLFQKEYQEIQQSIFKIETQINEKYNVLNNAK
jgi:chromosome segregation ATPase